jgi:hypothetical protein
MKFANNNKTYINFYNVMAIKQGSLLCIFPFLYVLQHDYFGKLNRQQQIIIRLMVGLMKNFYCREQFKKFNIPHLVPEYPRLTTVFYCRENANISNSEKHIIQGVPGGM